MLRLLAGRRASRLPSMDRTRAFCCPLTYGKEEHRLVVPSRLLGVTVYKSGRFGRHDWKSLAAFCSSYLGTPLRELRLCDPDFAVRFIILQAGEHVLLL
jgi:hypothetical protein